MTTQHAQDPPTNPDVDRLIRALRASLAGMGPHPVVERVVTEYGHHIMLTVGSSFVVMDQARARVVAEELDVAAVDPEVCGSCDRYAVSTDGLCDRHRADEGVGA